MAKAKDSNEPKSIDPAMLEALKIMEEGRGKHFDPKLLDLFLECFDKVVAVQEAYREESREEPAAEVQELR